MFMPERSERLEAGAYTRASVEEYLRAVAEERDRIELAIAEARQRRDVAQKTAEYLDSLERDAGCSHPPAVTPPVIVEE